MDKIITIGRQFGSGGHQIGEIIAKNFGIKCYDKNLITETAKNSNLHEDFIKEHDEKKKLFVPGFFTESAFGIYDAPVSQRVYLAQVETIKNIASNGPCVIIGRTADYILHENDNLFSIFVTGNLEDRIKEIIKRYPDIKDEKSALLMIKQKEKERKNFYNFYSEKIWGYAENYDLCINSSVFGIEKTAEIICDILDKQ